ncbi:MAG: response regulator [Gammaproteobacteria bacterium]|nr:response regulator [Gammaproteobacteria bacterium]
MQASYNYYLVSLSFFIAAYASYSMLSVSERLINEKESKIRWLVAGAATLGCGIWSMHFIGMLAYETNMPMGYSTGLTALSGVLSLSASAFAMYILGWGKLTPQRLLGGGVIIGLGVAGMHYMGMAAMIMPARISYDPFLFIISIIIAVTAATAALWIASQLAKENIKHHKILMFTAMIIMAVAITGMHYTGMAAAIYTMDKSLVVDLDNFDNTILIGTITLIALLIITSSLVASWNKSESHANNTILLVLTITTAVTICVGVTVGTLYDTAFELNNKQLKRNIITNKNIIRAVTEFDMVHSKDAHKDGARFATIGQIKNAYKGLFDSTEFFLFEKDKADKKIIFLIKKTPSQDIFPEKLPLDSDVMHVFKKALEGNSGSVKFIHPISKQYMLAAYAYIPELNVGILNAIKINEIREPFVDALLYTGFISLLVILSSVFLTININAPMIRSLKEEIVNRNKSEKDLLDLTNNLENIVVERTAELKKAVCIAEDAAKSKGEFLANMSHEIRTPMNGVLGMLQIIEDTKLTNEQKDYIQTAHKSAEALLTILNDILDFSKIEAGEIEFEKIDFSLQETIDDVASLLAEAAHKKGIELLVRLSSNVPLMVVGDPTRLRQILFNLTSNAIKFTEQGEVLLDVKLDGKEGEHFVIRIEVSDTGVGIAKTAQEKIFEMFKQEDGSTTRKFGGTGLGLAISKKLAMIMGGDILVKSSHGAGSTFTLIMQAELSHVKLPDERDHEKLKNLTMLIVDDNKTNCKILETLLSTWGINTVTAYDGQQGLDIVHRYEKSERVIDLILLDMMMPDMNGLEVAAQLQEEKSQIKMIMLTSLINSKVQEKSVTVGITACIHKPVRKTLLLDSMMMALELDMVEDEAIEKIKTVDANVSSNNEGVKPILIVEDNIVNQMVVRVMLEKMGYTLDLAEDGQECLDKLQPDKYSMIFMDCQMPVMDGFEATIKIRESDENKDVVIIAMTANAMEGDREKCLEVGMSDYISKPVNKSQLEEMILKWLPNQ